MLSYKCVNSQGEDFQFNLETKIRLDRAVSKMILQPIKKHRRKRRAKVLLTLICLILAIVTLIHTITIWAANIASKDDISSVIMYDEPLYIAQPLVEIIAEESIEELEVEESAQPEESQAFKPQAISDELFNVIQTECANSNVPVEVVLAIMKTESQSFNVNAKSSNSDGSYDSGIMQINSSNISAFARRYNVPEFRNNPMDPVANVTVGIRHIAEMYNAYKESYQDDVRTLLATAGGYNRGVRNQNKYKNIYDYNTKTYLHYQNIINNIDTNIDYSIVGETKQQLRNTINLE